jgi:nucleotide-binding universal stress UspA family protein
MKTLDVSARISLKNVLFATDFAPCSSAALPYAISFARRSGTTLHVAHILPTGADLVFMSPEAWPVALEEEKRWVEECTEQLGKQLQGLPHDVVTPKGKIPNAVARIIEEEKIDLLVLGTHGRTGLRKLFVGSIAEEVFRGSPCAVLTVGPKVSLEESDQIQFRHILFATDFSDDSLAALPYAISLAEEDHARLSLLYVVGQPATAVLRSDELKANLTRRLEELAKPEDYPRCRPDYLVEFTPLFEPAGEKIVEVARVHGADLVVLGVHPTHGAVSTVTHLVHTTAQHIVAHATCPVLTVRG